MYDVIRTESVKYKRGNWKVIDDKGREKEKRRGC